MVKAALTRARQFDLMNGAALATIARMKRLALIAAILFAVPAAAADVVVADVRALEAALAGAAAFDRILVAPGYYGDLTIGPRAGRGAVTIVAADAAAQPVFRSIVLNDVHGLTLQNLTVAFGSTLAPREEQAIAVRRSSSVRLERLEVSSAANANPADDAVGIVIRDSRAVTVAGVELHDVFRGVVIFDSDSIAVTGSRFERIGSDGVAARGAVDLQVENNVFTDFTPVDPVKWHPDAIQLWSRGASRANERVVIRGNVVRRGAGGPTQGVFIKSPEIASRDILVEGNTIVQSMGQGIFVQNGVGIVIRNNSLSAVAPLLHPPAIEVRAPFDDAAVEDNVAPKFRLPPGVAARRNVATQ